MNLKDIGSHLRVARMQRGMSLREMARRIEVSPSFVSQVELGKAIPSVGTLYAIVSELELSLDELMADESSPGEAVTQRPAGADGSSQVVSAEPGPSAMEPPNGNDRDGHPFSSANGSVPLFASGREGRQSPLQRADARARLQVSGATWERLTNGDDPFVDFLHVTYVTGGESCPPDHFIHHGGREYGYVITGRLRVQVAFDDYVLEPGDSVSFDSMTPHRLSNPYEEESLSLWVVVGRRGSMQL
ncbi:MAG: Transcriptional regulator, Cro/CI [Streptosporangiaceae bacterium]|jgi:transcriptional regulator with XRE-family HTH domain|nr:Transcriptional regulator, Cro/CI [Streptosporangiaceae bacterium]